VEGGRVEAAEALVYEQRSVVDRTALLLRDLGEAQRQGQAREETFAAGERTNGPYRAAAEGVMDVELEACVRGAFRFLQRQLVPPCRHVLEVGVAVRQHLAEYRAEHEGLQVHPGLALHLARREVVEAFGSPLALLERGVLFRQRVVATQVVGDRGSSARRYVPLGGGSLRSGGRLVQGIGERDRIRSL